MHKGAFLVAGLVALSAAPVAAQGPQANGPSEMVRTIVGDMPVPVQRSNTVRVQSNISYFVSVAAGDEAAAETERQKARKTIYEMASRECASLLEALAKECRLVTLNSNINAARAFAPTQPNGFTVTGSMSFQIVPK